MQVLLIGNHRSSNPGNTLLTTGTKALLDSSFISSRITSYKYLDLSDYSFGSISNEALIDAINSSDLAVLCGSIIFNGQIHYGATGCRLNLPAELISQIKRPFLFYGVSSRIWSFQDYSHGDKLPQFFESLAANANISFRFRDDASSFAIRALIQFCTGLDYVYPNENYCKDVPDPALHALYDKNYFFNFCSESMPTSLVININGEDGNQRFHSSRSKFSMAELIDVIAEHIKETESYQRIVLQPHGPADLVPLSTLVEQLPAKTVHQRLEFGPLPKPSCHMNMYKSVYADPNNVVISMRIHSINAALSLGLRTLPIASSSRISAMLERQTPSIPTIRFGDHLSTDRISKALDIYADKSRCESMSASIAELIEVSQNSFNSSLLEILPDFFNTGSCQES